MIIERESLIRFLDLRWKLNGVQQLQDLFVVKRQEALFEDINLYRQTVSVFEQAIESRLLHNQEQLLQVAPVTLQQFEASNDHHFAQVDADFVWILNIDDFLHTEVPDRITVEVAEQVYNEIKELQLQILEQEQERLQQEIDFDSEEGNYIRSLALDLKLKEYQITERMLKKVIYTNHVSTVYHSTDSDTDA